MFTVTRARGNRLAIGRPGRLDVDRLLGEAFRLTRGQIENEDPFLKSPAGSAV